MNDRPWRSLPRQPLAPRSESIVRILVAVPDELDRKSLIALLSTAAGVRVVGEAADAARTIELCRQHPHDILALDLSLPGTDRESAVATILRNSPVTRILAVAPHDSEKCWLLNARARTEAKAGKRPSRTYPPCLRVALAEGALGGIRRSDPIDELFAAIRSVGVGRTWLGRRGLRDLTLPGNGDGAQGPKPSARERQVAVLVSDGLSNEEIGLVLGITEPTVKKHISHLLHKLGVADRLQLGLYVVRRPLLFLGPTLPIGQATNEHFPS